MGVLTKALENTCKDTPYEPVNIATGKVTTAVTSDNLTRGKDLRKKFPDECAKHDEILEDDPKMSSNKLCKRKPS